MNKSKILAVLILLFCLFNVQAQVNTDQALLYCAEQAKSTLKLIPSQQPDIPRSINSGEKAWRFVIYKDWCSGFWPGILWYLYEATGDNQFKIAGDKFSKELAPLSSEKAFDHDLGFQIFNSFGNGYRLTNNQEYKQIILKTADTLATLYNPKVGTILSWPRSVPNMEWPQHNTIIDNMINLELLFWASKNGGRKYLYDVAVNHAKITMKNHFRADFSAYHAVVYDKLTGKKIKGVTHQGYADDSMWARGQSWAIYGYTICFRETKDPVFLDFAQKVTNVYLKSLPADGIPYWDFNDPAIPNAPKDASAAAVVASALLELSTFVQDKTRRENYYKAAEQMLTTLSSLNYQSRDKNSAFLLHSTGHKPNGSEIDASIIYADYYYIEALLKLKNSRKDALSIKN